MIDLTVLEELVKILGFSAVIFVMWYMDHQAKTKQLDDLIEKQSTREAMIFSQLSSVVTQYSEQSAQNFDLLKGMIETNIYQTSIMQEIKDKINNNEFCPFVKSFLKGKDFIDVANNANKD